MPPDRRQLEEGELEDGELPDDQESGEADEGEAGEAGEAVEVPRAQESDSHLQRSQQRDRDNDKLRDRERDRLRDDRPTDDREKAELMQDLADLTKSLTLTDAMKSVDQVCQDLKAAIKKLDRLYRRVKRRKGDDMEAYPEVNAFSRAICNGLRNICVLSSTNHAQSSRWDWDLTRGLMRTALNYRHDIMSSASKRDFETTVREARPFRDMLEERDRAAGREQQEAGTSKAASPHTQGSGPAPVQSDNVPPPPPDDPQPSPSARTASASGAPPHLGHRQEQPPPAPPLPPAAPSSKANAADTAAAGSRGFKFKIVVTSTDADIRNPHQQQQQRQQQQQQQREGATTAGTEQHKRTAESASTDQVAKRTKLSPSSEFSPPTSPLSAADASNGISAQQPSAQQAAQQGSDFSDLPELAQLPLAASIQALLQQRRLCLVLDLDHTLVNSARFSEVAPEHAALLEARYEREFALPEQQRELFRVSKLGMWTKLRPGLREFLRRAHERFELWIHTAGNSMYAEQVMELVDPGRQYFGSRIIAADEENNAHMVKRLVSGLEGREPIAIIVDDSQAVWPHDRRNLYTVERYIYFPSSKERFGLHGLSLLEIERDECPLGGMLMTAAAMFEEIHSATFDALEKVAAAAAAAAADPPGSSSWDVREVLQRRKRQVLAGVVVAFSRVIPLEMAPHTHALWRLAEEYGARCSSALTPDVTHVVATSRATEKVFQATQQQKHVVSVGWLECSCTLWRRANEQRFPVPV